MHLGLIAGNGRFPFLVLDAARSMGHDVTVVATKEETFRDLDDAAAKAGAAIHWISLGELGKCISLLKNAGVTQAVMAGQVKHTKIFAGGIRPDVAGRDRLLTHPPRGCWEQPRPALQRLGKASDIADHSVADAVVPAVPSGILLTRVAVSPCAGGADGARLATVLRASVEYVVAVRAGRNRGNDG